MKLSQDQAQAVAGLMRTSHDFRSFLEALGTYAEELNKNLIFNDNLELGVMQGQMRSVAEIMKAIENAAETFEKYENQS